MASAQTHSRTPHCFSKCLVIVVLGFLVNPISRAQDTPPVQHPEAPWAQDLNKYPGLPAELARLFEKLLQTVQFPAPRTESRLLPLLPPSTISYMAIPNYGDAAADALRIFHQELQQSSVLRDWWGHGQLAESGPKLEEGLDQISHLHQYLGDEIVISASMDGKEPAFLLVSEVRKPGLKQFLQQTTTQFAGKSKAPLRVLDIQELAAAKTKTPADDLIVLVRPDFVVVSSDLAALRMFNARLDSSQHEFASTPFGQRVVQEYRGGVTVMAGVDLHKILEKSSPTTKQSTTFQHSGFEDMQYLMWDHKTVDGKPLSQMELSFNSPRHGAASWLSKPTTLGSLDFVSPKAILAGTLVLSSPAQIFDDAKQMATLSGSNSFASVPTFEQALKLSLKDDLLSLLGGEITIELDSINPPQPQWKVMLAVKDAKHLQQTLSSLMTTARLQSNDIEDDGVTYHTLQIPYGKNTTDIAYAFIEGYLIVGSGRYAVAEAVQMHRSGESLAKSKKFLASLPPGHSLEASALLFEDPIAMTGLWLHALMPQLADSITQYAHDGTPAVICVYGEDAAVREMSSNSTSDAAMVLVWAAIAIPNLLRSRTAANEASAVGSVRTLNTAQVTYEVMYPRRGFASNLASLGPDSQGTSTSSPAHAALIDASLAQANCSVDGWCTKSGYKFRVSTICKLQPCKEYLAVATPVSSSTGTRSFCSTSDGVIRVKLGEPITAPLTVVQCKAWPPIQ